MLFKNAIYSVVKMFSFGQTHTPEAVLDLGAETEELSRVFKMQNKTCSLFPYRTVQIERNNAALNATAHTDY